MKFQTELKMSAKTVKTDSIDVYLIYSNNFSRHFFPHSENKCFPNIQGSEEKLNWRNSSSTKTMSEND